MTKEDIDIEIEARKKMIEELCKNPKILKALQGLLEPLQQEGDTLTISTGEDLK